MSKNTLTAEQKAAKKATTIQSVKTVAVLVVICLVCCLLLSVCNDLFYISDEDRFQRSMAKIYPNFVNDDSFDTTLNAQYKIAAEYGEIKSVARSTDGAYIVEALGNGGYGGGTVTLYVIVGGDAKIIGWAVKENVSQSYINRIPSDAGSTWYVGADVSSSLQLDMTGATVVLTSTAINHAVNMAAYYCRNALNLGQNPEADALYAVQQLLGTEYSSLVWQNKTQVLNASVDNKTVAQLLSTNENSASYLFLSEEGLQAFVYGAQNFKIVVLKDGAVVASNVQQTDEILTKLSETRLLSFQFGSYTAFAVVTLRQETGKCVYTVAGLNVDTVPGTYVLEVTIENASGVGKVTNIVATTNGYVSGSPSQSDADKLITSLVGATSATIDGIYSGDKVAGATQSANLITAAVKAALKLFDAELV